jgi:hypothetical protein
LEFEEGNDRKACNKGGNVADRFELLCPLFHIPPIFLYKSVPQDAGVVECTLLQVVSTPFTLALSAWCRVPERSCKAHCVVFAKEVPHEVLAPAAHPFRFEQKQRLQGKGAGSTTYDERAFICQDAEVCEKAAKLLSSLASLQAKAQLKQ